MFKNISKLRILPLVKFVQEREISAFRLQPAVFNWRKYYENGTLYIGQNIRFNQKIFKSENILESSCVKTV